MGKKKMLMRKFGSVAIVNNTFIGGVASVINTPALLASTLRNYPSGTAFNVANIKSFRIVGSDIECYIEVEFQTKGDAFKDSSITYFKNTSKLKEFEYNSFVNCNSLVTVEALDCVECGYPVWAGFTGSMSNLKTIYVPNLINLGGGFLNNYVFRYLGQNANFNNLKFYANTFLQTCNSGSPDGDLTYLIDTMGGTVRYIASFTKPNPVTDLSVNTVYATAIKLDWSVPSSTNAIDFYEVYVDGVFYENSSTNEIIVTGLTNLQTYNFSVVAVDIFYNKSEMSNVVTQQINGVDPVFSDPSSIISYYKFENNVLDSVGTNDGIATDITYTSGQVGNAAVFNGSTSYVDIGSGVAGGRSAYSISCIFKMSADEGNNTIFGSWLTPNNNIIRVNNGALQWYTSTSAQVGGTFTLFTDITSFHHLVCTYDGSVMKMYLDGVDTGASFNQSGVVNVGGQNEAWGRERSNYGNHIIDDGAIFDRALTQTEVTEINNIHNEGFPLI